MSALTTDVTIRAALRRYRRAAELVVPAVRELRAALRMLERHPGYRKTKRYDTATRGPRRRPFAPHVTMAYWLHSCIGGVAHEASLLEAPGWIRADLRGAGRGIEQSLREFIQTERQDLAYFARRRRPRK